MPPDVNCTTPCNKVKLNADGPHEPTAIGWAGAGDGTIATCNWNGLAVVLGFVGMPSGLYGPGSLWSIFNRI